MIDGGIYSDLHGSGRDIEADINVDATGTADDNLAPGFVDAAKRELERRMSNQTPATRPDVEKFEYRAKQGIRMEILQAADMLSLCAYVLRLEQALDDVMKSVEDGLLVRDTSHDAQPDWAVRQILMVTALANTQAALSEKAS